MAFNLEYELDNYVKILRDTYKKPERANVNADMYLDFGRILISENNEELIKGISTCSSFLNKRKYDSFYIPYALYMNFKGVTFDLNDPEFSKYFTKEEKIENLSNSIEFLKTKLDNKEFIEKLYQLIRSGDNIDIIYNTNKLQILENDISKTKRMTDMVSEMFENSANK